MYCAKLKQPRNPEIDCKFGFETNIICNKTYCLKGPDDECNDEWGCAEGLKCCGICMGCTVDNQCSHGICNKNNLITAKRLPPKSLWFPEYYQRQEEKKRSQQMQYHQQQEERQRQQPPRLPSSRDFMNTKSSVDRLPYYPMNTNFEYPLLSDD